MNLALAAIIAGIAIGGPTVDTINEISHQHSNHNFAFHQQRPTLSISGQKLKWTAVAGAKSYLVIENPAHKTSTRFTASSTSATAEVIPNETISYSVREATPVRGLESNTVTVSWGSSEKEANEKAKTEKEAIEKTQREHEAAEKAKTEKEAIEKTQREHEAAEKAKTEKEAAEKSQKEHEGEKPTEEVTASVFLSPSGNDSNSCTQTAPCLTLTRGDAAANGTVTLLPGTYAGQQVTGSKPVVFSGTGVKFSGTIYVFASNVTFKGFEVQSVVVGNYDETPGRPNPNNVSLLGLTGKNFEIDSSTNVAVEGGSYGPDSACGGPYGGGNNSIREPIPGVTPENIVINNITIHDVQSYNLINCHIEGLAIFAGNHVTVSNSKFYGNSVYDIFIQANSGGSPNNVTIAKNWLADAEDNSGANGSAVGTHNGIAFGSEISSNLTLLENHFNGIININDAESIGTFSGVTLTKNYGRMAYNGYPCGSVLKGVVWNENVWANDKCGSSDINLNGPLPYINGTDDSTLNYEIR